MLNDKFSIQTHPFVCGWPRWEIRGSIPAPGGWTIHYVDQEYAKVTND